MLQLKPPRRILLTIDSVGGVWRYGLDLARGLADLGIESVFVGFDPPPDREQREEAEALGDLHWCGLPLDWQVRRVDELERVPETVATIAAATKAEIIQVNAPSQAAGLASDVPVVAVSHSCVTSWFLAVRGTGLPADWAWQGSLNQAGLSRADAIVAPSRSHADLLARCYRDTGIIQVVPNACRSWPLPARQRQPFAYAAARWWDEGKNASCLDAAAALAEWPIVAVGANTGPQGQRFYFRNVEHRGEVTHAEVRQLAGQASIFVSPSIYEPFGLAALEAARAGAALVMADIPTYRELWDGAALFADPADPEDFAAALDALARDPDRCHAYAARAGIRCAQWTVQRQAAAMADLYARLAGPAATAAPSVSLAGAAK
jgi:glycosyltransferase involved in cell wall biosynthesis